jgi:2-polyprenyl-3-methyl-5-hydroxy-6-metoxy-1,4-benzoquinol methylase
MTTGESNHIRLFYESSDRYLDICESRQEANFRNILDVIAQYVPKDARLLEFGCGTGNLASLVAAKGFRVLGVDISERFIGHAKRTYAAHQSNLDFAAVGFGPLPFSDTSFDCIFTCAVLEHCYEVEKIVSDFHRLLRPGGILIIGTPNLLSPFTRTALIARRLLGKRKRYHLYGTPAFLLKTLWYNLQKMLSRHSRPIYVTPRYDGFNESDEDVTYLSTHRDYLAMLKPLHYQVLELARGDSKVGKLIARLFPKLSGEVLIVAVKTREA